MPMNDQARRAIAANVARNVVGADVVGYDNQGYDAAAASGPTSHYDAGGRRVLPPGDSTLKPIVLSVANAAALSVTLFNSTDFPSTTPAAVTSSSTEYAADLLWFYRNPGKVTGVQITSSETAAGAPLLTSMQLVVSRTNVFGRTESNTFQVSSTFSPGDYQGFRAIIDLNEDLDLFTNFQFTTATNASGSTQTFTLIFSVGLRVEGRASLSGLPGGAHQPLVSPARPIAGPPSFVRPRLPGR